MSDFMFEKPSASPETFATIRLSERDVRAARQLLELLAEPNGSAATLAAQVGAASVPLLNDAPANLDRHGLAARARRIFTLRRQRTQVFGKGMFGEPAWDMLIALYMEDAAGPRTTVGRLSEFAETALTTAIRWLDYLEQHGLVRREPHPTDRRAIFVDLTDKGRSAMERYLSGTLLSAV